jgi:hypothetical protein
LRKISISVPSAFRVSFAERKQSEKKLNIDAINGRLRARASIRQLHKYPIVASPGLVSRWKEIVPLHGAMSSLTEAPKAHQPESFLMIDEKFFRFFLASRGFHELKCFRVIDYDYLLHGWALVRLRFAVSGEAKAQL